MTSTGLWKRERLLCLSWSDVGNCMEKVFTEMVKRRVHPTTIVGVWRGGMVLSVFLANHFHVRDLQVIAISRNRNDERYALRAAPRLDWIAPSISLQDQDVLIADDIVGDGGTLEMATAIVNEGHPRTIWTAAIVKNQNCRTAPHFCGYLADDWVVFPWEAPSNK